MGRGTEGSEPAQFLRIRWLGSHLILLAESPRPSVFQCLIDQDRSQDRQSLRGELSLQVSCPVRDVSDAALRRNPQITVDLNRSSW